MRISNNYNSYNRPSFGAFRITSPAKKRVQELLDIVSPFSALRLQTDLDNAQKMFKKLSKDDLVLYIKDGKLSVSYFMRDDTREPYATARLDVVDSEHVCRFARRLRQYTEYGEFFDDMGAFLKKTDVKREFV